MALWSQKWKCFVEPCNGFCIWFGTIGQAKVYFVRILIIFLPNPSLSLPLSSKFRFFMASYSRLFQVVYSDVYMLDDEMKWKELPPMPKPDSHIEFAWVVVNNSIVIVGGTTEKHPVTKKMVLNGEVFRLNLDTLVLTFAPLLIICLSFCFIWRYLHVYTYWRTCTTCERSCHCLISFEYPSLWLTSLWFLYACLWCDIRRPS